MNPVTLVASVAATSRLIRTILITLYRFIQDTREVDNDVNALYCEVENLESKITAINKVLHEPTTQVVIQQDRDCNLGRAVDDSLLECQNTLQSLDKLLEGIKVTKKARKLFQLALGQIALNWKSDEFCTLRGKMHSHCTAIQLALQTIDVLVCSKGPDIVVTDLSPRLDTLISMIAELGMNGSSQHNAKSRAQLAVTPTSATKSLKDSANRVVSSASSIIGSRSTHSRGNESVSSTPQASNESTGYSTTYSESTSASNQSGIAASNHSVSQSEDGSPQNQFQADGPHQPNSPNRRNTRTLPSGIPVIPEDMEAYRDIKLELIQSMVEIALKHLHEAQKEYKSYKHQLEQYQLMESNYRQAQSTLGKALSKALATRETIENHQRTVHSYNKLCASGESHKRASLQQAANAEKRFNLALSEAGELLEEQLQELDLDELRLNMAFVYKVQEKWDLAETSLLRLTEGSAPGSVDPDTASVLRACHELAALYLQHGRLEEAEMYCRRALLGRRRIFGSEDELYRESMLLTIDICKKSGQALRAEAYEAALASGAGKAKRS